ncbi:MAG TPA: Mov34/MPN/PAD-1 family protein, partial [Chitinophagaceae bacterium]|nr:Mov34/MPN/PAD-1 family protein [Chitinophagaceae bacterium]
MKNCTEIIFSTRACNAMISETLDKIPTETGGILLGRVIDSVWYVLESIDPGPNSIFTITYFEYDTPYVNHLANMLSKQYKLELEVLGLWHRHPGSLDRFSNTDNGTNAAFARMTSKGAISGLINIDPTLRLTMYHVGYPLHYEQIPFKIGDHLLPGRLFEYKHSEEKNQISLNQHCLPFVSRNTLPSEEIKVPKGVEAIKAWIKQNASYIQAINLLADRYKKLLALYHNKHIINEQSLEKVLKEEISLDEEGYRYECKTRGSRLI